MADANQVAQAVAEKALWERAPRHIQEKVATAVLPLVEALTPFVEFARHLPVNDFDFTVVWVSILGQTERKFIPTESFRRAVKALAPYIGGGDE